MKPRHWPRSFLLFFALGIASTFAGIAALAGAFANAHPLLADDLAGWGLIVSAIAFFLSGAFPLAIRRLAEREGA